MPFDDLTDQQQTFILKYFKSGAIRKKTKARYEDFNWRLQQEVVPLYDKINALKALLGRIEAAEADVPEGVPMVPVSLYQGLLAEYEGQIESILAKGRKLIKSGQIPDFSPVQTGLGQLETRLKEQFERMRAGARAQTLSNSEKLLSGKESAVGEHQDMLDLHYTGTNDAYRAACKMMASARLDAITERDAKYTEYNKAYLAARTALTDLLKRQGTDDSVDVPTFTQACAQIVHEFTSKGDTLKDRIVALGNLPPLTQEDLDTIKAQDAFKDTAPVVISAQRKAALDAEVAKLAGNMDDESIPEDQRSPGAIAAQKQKLEDLRTEYRSAGEAERKKLKGQYEALNAQIEKLELRKAQLEAYAEKEISRDRQIVASLQAAQQAKTVANALGVVLADEDGDLGALDFPWLDGPAPGADSTVVMAQILDARTKVEADAQLDLTVQKLSPDEPTPKKISQDECDTLLTMLGQAEQLVEEGRIDIAEKLVAEVRRLRLEFAKARIALRLPVISKQRPSQAKALIGRLEAIRQDANDAWGQGVAQAAALAKDADDLINQITTDEVAGHFIHTPDLHKSDVEGLRTRVDEMMRTIAPVPISETARKNADDTANAISDFLDSALKTKPLKDTDIIREPGRTYPEQVEKHLVPRENLIMVEVNGKMEQHKIVTKVGKGGVESASRSRGEKVPKQVLEAMVARNHALRAMTEVDTPGGEAMLETYRAEAQAWFDDVSANGETIYPYLAKLISGCDKVLKKGEIATYIPDPFPAFKTRYEKFKDGYLQQKPSDAKAEGDALKQELVTLERAAKEIVKPEYEIVKGKYDGLLATLTGKQKKGEPETLGGFIEAFLAKTPEEVFGDVSKLTQDGAKAAEAARARFVKLQEFYKKNSKKISPKSVEGPWMTDAKAALKTLDTKIESNIAEARTKLTEIEQAVTAYHSELSDMGKLSGDDLAKKVNELCKEIQKSALAAGEAYNAKVRFNKARARLKDALKAELKELKKLGKNPIAQDLKNEADALEARRKGAGSKADADEDFASGLSEMEDIERDLETITANRADLDPSARVKIKKIRIGERLSTLENVLEKLNARASELAGKDIVAALSETQKDTLAQDVAVIDAGLKKIGTVISIADLKRITDEIDAKNDDEAKSWKAERVALRERALKEMRALRAKLDTHPAAQLYAGNPFDRGTNMRLVLSALHHVEIAVLSSVSPKDPD